MPLCSDGARHGIPSGLPSGSHLRAAISSHPTRPQKHAGPPSTRPARCPRFAGRPAAEGARRRGVGEGRARRHAPRPRRGRGRGSGRPAAQPSAPAAPPSLPSRAVRRAAGRRAMHGAREPVPRGVQFREGNVPGEKCLAQSVYGHVSAVTPIFDGPLTGRLTSDPPNTSYPTSPPPCTTRDQRRSRRLSQGRRHPQHLRTRSRRPGHLGRLQLLRPEQGPARKLPQSLHHHQQGQVLLKAHSGKQLSYKTPLKPAGCKKKGKKRSKCHAAR